MVKVMTKISEEFEAEMMHWVALKRKYHISCMKGESDEIWTGDTVRIIICLKSYFNETEEQVIARLEATDIDHPVQMNDEVFWIEK